ncbi:hypothetical protein FS749_011574 [Ceratobasidium sp. UAMH 11750]|nr:hypothetical protein FS749_011574 [Ceratobasidium sp. UAMH 11750]
MSVHRRSPSFTNGRFTPLSPFVSPIRALSRLASRISSFAFVSPRPRAPIGTLTVSVGSTVTTYNLTRIGFMPRSTLAEPGPSTERLALPGIPPATVETISDEGTNDQRPTAASTQPSSAKDAAPPAATCPGGCDKETPHLLCCFQPFGLCDAHSSALRQVFCILLQDSNDNTTCSAITQDERGSSESETNNSHVESNPPPLDQVRTYHFRDEWESGRLTYSPPIPGATYNRWVFLPPGRVTPPGLVRVIGDVDVTIAKSGDRFAYMVYCQAPGNPASRYWVDLEVGTLHPLAPNYYFQHHHNQALQWVYQAGQVLCPPLEDRFFSDEDEVDVQSQVAGSPQTDNDGEVNGGSEVEGSGIGGSEGEGSQSDEESQVDGEYEGSEAYENEAQQYEGWD